MWPTERLILLHAHDDVIDNVYNFSQWNFATKKNYQQIDYVQSIANTNWRTNKISTKIAEIIKMQKHQLTHRHGWCRWWLW